MNQDDVRVFYNSMAWRAMRNYIRERDNQECQWCKAQGIVKMDTGALNRNGRKKNSLIVHHIEELKDKPELRLEEDNLILICFECHERHHERWKENGTGNKWRNDERW